MKLWTYHLVYSLLITVDAQCTRKRRRSSSLKPKFHLAHHVSSRHDWTRSTCRAHAFLLGRACQTARIDTLNTTSSTRQVRLDRHDERDRRDSQLSSLCNSYSYDI